MTAVESGPRAVIYVRESVAGEEKISLELQEKAGRDHCARKGYTVVKVAEPDSGLSASRVEYTQRPGVVEAIEAVERGDADVIVVYLYSRISRERFDQAVINRRIERAGGALESVTQGDDPFARDIHQVIDAEFSREKSRTWKSVQARRRELGLTHGGPVPFGYRRAAARDQPHEPDPITAPVVDGLYRRYIAGRGPQSLAEWLNERGHRTPRGRPFGQSTVTRLLANAYYAGYVRDGAGDWKRGAHEPILSEATWRDYLREREARTLRHPTQPRARQPKWPLGGGLSTCALCDANLVLSSYAEPDPARRKYPRALCTRHNSTRECKGVSIARHKLEAFVSLWLVGHLQDLADRAASPADDDRERARLQAELTRTYGEEDKVRRGLATAARLVVEGDMPDDDYRAAKRDAEARLGELADEVSRLRAELDALDPDRDVLDRFESATADVSVD
ncbi:recombinase family protein [Haloechinothrix salitolerans]|uniref:Recombinase family protein n=1 Tax=Haloechinothrix salitolerans TaxID=926830 RepID=A0ABW2C7A6_9PSEU